MNTRKVKRVLAMLLAVVMLLGIVPMGDLKAGAINQSEFESKLSSFRSSYYNHGSHYNNNDSGSIGSQCFGYANFLARYVFGSFPSSWSDGSDVKAGWTVTYGSSAIDNIHIGDIIRYKTSSVAHSIFVTGISGDTIYYTDANSDRNNTVKWEQSETKSYFRGRLALSIGNTLGWVGHYKDWNDYSEPPKGQWIYANKSNLTVGEELSLNFNADNASWYVLGIYHNGVLTTINNGSSDWYTTSFSEAGVYSIHAAIYNNVGHVDTEEIVINVYEKYNQLPEGQWIWADKDTIEVNESISFNFNASYASWYVLGIYHNGILTTINNGSSDWYTTSFSEAGVYSIHAAIYNNVGHVDTNDFIVNVYSCIHNYNDIETVLPSCKENGIKTFACTKCKHSYTETIAKNASNHVGGTTVKNATAATCTATGYTGDTYCNGCNIKLSAGKTIDKTAHTDLNNDGYCDNCKAELTPHTPSDPTPATTPCTCKCHSKGFTLFIWKIGNFFHRIFRMNKYRECPCGNKKHW